MSRYKRVRKAKPGELKAVWGNTREQGEDVYYAWGEGCAKADGSLLNTVLGCECATGFDNKWNPAFIDELTRRGYDIKTLKFSIRKLAAPEPEARKKLNIAGFPFSRD